MVTKKHPSEQHDLTFGRFVRNKRLELNIGLRDFAKKVRLSPAFISKMEIGDFKPPKEENIVKIATILHLDKDELLAMAKKLSSEISQIILQKPKLYASFLRKVNSDKLEQFLNENDIKEN